VRTADRQFAQNIALLLITGMVSGLGVPYVINRIDHRRAQQQRELDAVLARQRELLSAQATLVSDLSSSLWRWRYIAMRLTYYGARPGSDTAAAEQQYDERFWDSINVVREQIGRAKRLVSDTTYRLLLRFYEQNIVELDRNLAATRRLSGEDRKDAFLQRNQWIYDEMTTELDALLDDLAAELSLKRAGP
jgi:hypothetical protein